MEEKEEKEVDEYALNLLFIPTMSHEMSSEGMSFKKKKKPTEKADE